jgi:hypothetical protein
MTIKFKNLPEFNKELEIFGKKTVPGDEKRLASRIALDLLRRIVFRNPVDTGRSRGNWQTVVGQSNESQVEGGAPLATGAAVIASAPPYSLITIFNNVEYIRKLEEGSSQQAPRGMVRVSVAEVESQYS